MAAKIELTERTDEGYPCPLAHILRRVRLKAHPFFDNSTRNFKGMAQPLRTISALATKPNIVQHS
jgi:hypothetical protein